MHLCIHPRITSPDTTSCARARAVSRVVQLVLFTFQRQLDRRGSHLPDVRIHTGTMGLAVRVLQHGTHGHGVVLGLVVVRVRHPGATPVHIAGRAGAHHQQPHQRRVHRQGEADCII